MTIGDYIDLVKMVESNLEFQRQVIKGFKPYERLRSDLRVGGVMPPPVLALKEGVWSREMGLAALPSLLRSTSSEQIYILDGLQRTNAVFQVMKQITDDGHQEEAEQFRRRLIRVELWPDVTLNSLTYRMILLNAGQKPMSLRHQLEIVNLALRDFIYDRFSGKITLYMERDSDRRSQPGEYQFSLIAQSFHAFLQKSPHIDIRNEVVEELRTIDVLESYSGNHAPTERFCDYVNFLLEFDRHIFRVYPDIRRNQQGESIPSGKTLLTRDTFHLGLGAAYSWCDEQKPDLLRQAKSALLESLRSASQGVDDPLSLEMYERIFTGFRKRDNVGEQRRNVTFRGLREYFSNGGSTPMSKCWYAD
jgi:hypothetical protein